MRSPDEEAVENADMENEDIAENEAGRGGAGDRGESAKADGTGDDSPVNTENSGDEEADKAEDSGNESPSKADSTGGDSPMNAENSGDEGADKAENAGRNDGAGGRDDEAGGDKEDSHEPDLMDEVNLDREERIGAVEALLFCTGASVELSKLAQSICATEEETREAVTALESRYRSKRSGLEVMWLEDSVQLCSKKNYYGVLRRLIGTPRRATLSETVLETLSIVAYKQPVTRIEIENIRGVSCGHQINKLLEYDLIKELGRLDAPGKPLLFGTTEQFLKSFGVTSIDELPRATPAQIADFQAEAEKEVEEVKV